MTTADWPSEAEELVRSGHRQSQRGKPWKGRDRCGKGHLFTPENTLPRADSSDGARRCRECKLEMGRRWYWENGGRELRQGRRHGGGGR
jgi:hypothetical protein